MSSQISSLFEEIKETIECREVSGDVLPLPPSSGGGKFSLIVNCFFDSSDFSCDSIELLGFCRKETIRSLKVIQQFVRDGKVQFDNVGVCFFRHGESGQNVRIYWANSRKDVLLDEEKTELAVVAEGSSVQELMSLLESGNDSLT